MVQVAGQDREATNKFSFSTQMKNRLENQHLIGPLLWQNIVKLKLHTLKDKSFLSVPALEDAGTVGAKVKAN